MPYDADESRMLGDLQELSKQISAVYVARDYFDAYCSMREGKAECLADIDKVTTRMDEEYKRLLSRLRIHRQKVAESGVKY